MKKVLILTVAIAFTAMLHAQEKGLYIFGGGQVGKTNFNYALKEGSTSGAVGYGGGVGIQYFFTYNVGLSLGFNVQRFNTKSLYSARLFEFPDQIDDEEHSNTLRIKLLNWVEAQKTTFIDIPLMITLQKKFGMKELHGVYFGAGVKLQVPVKSTYERSLGSVNVSAYYPDDNIIFGEEGYSVELPQHNLGANNYRFWSGKSQLKTGLAVTGEAGFLFGLSRRVDLRIGVMADYALLNIQKEQKVILNPTGIQQEGGFIADKVDYVGVLNSNQTNNNIRPFSLQGYLGLRIKLGGLKDLEAQNEEKYGRFRDNQPDTIYIVSKRDTIIVQFPSDFADKIAAAAGTSRQGNKQANPDFIPAWYVLDPDDDLSDSLSRENVKAKAQKVVEIMSSSIYFDLGKYELKTEAIKVLDQKIAFMKRYPDLKISLIAHTCDIGDDKLNDQLSKNRAEMARFYMISQGISATRLQDVPMGKKFPTYPNTDEYNRSQNRRVDFKVAN